MKNASIHTSWPCFRLVGPACCAAVTFLFVGAAAAATIEGVEKELTQMHNKLKSYTATVETHQDVDLGQGNRTKHDSKGTIEWVRRDGKVLFRMDGKGTSISVTNGDEVKSKTTSIMICDGEFNYALSDTDGRKTAVKMKADPRLGSGGEAMFTAWHRDYVLKLLPDEKIEGKDCWVIEAKSRKPDDGNPFPSQRNWFRKDTGLSVKTVMLGQDDKPMMTNTMTDIKLDVELKPQRFQFKLPEGVELTDMTKLEAQSAPAEAKPAKSEAKPAESVAPKESGQTSEKKPAEEKPKKDDKSVKGLLKKVLK